jgi:hypothetical protein
MELARSEYIAATSETESAIGKRRRREPFVCLFAFWLELGKVKWISVCSVWEGFIDLFIINIVTLKWKKDRRRKKRVCCVFFLSVFEIERVWVSLVELKHLAAGWYKMGVYRLIETQVKKVFQIQKCTNTTPTINLFDLMPAHFACFCCFFLLRVTFRAPIFPQAPLENTKMSSYHIEREHISLYRMWVCR